MPAQTLARPGWAGSGLTLEPWYLHAIFYRLDPHRFSASPDAGTPNLRGVASRLDYLRSLGVDAIMLTHLAPPASGGTGAQELDPALGSLDDFDDLVREASRDSLRVLVELSDASRAVAATRFWLGHGVAGVSVPAASDLQELRRVAHSFPGQRILIAPTGAPDILSLPALAAVPDLNPDALRSALEALEASAGRTPTLSSIRQNDPAAAKVWATLLLATRANGVLSAGEEMGLPESAALIPWGLPNAPAAGSLAAQDADPASLLSWTRRLIDLHHGNATMRSGSIEFLDQDARSLVWVAHRGSVSFANPAIVVACNLSASPITLSLVAGLQGLHLRGNFLRTVLRSDDGMGGMKIETVTLPPFGVYIGELLY